jgi:hypothetical protein
VPKAELNDFRPTNLNVANGFNAPKANASLYGVTLDSGGISSIYKDGKINVNNDLVVKGDNVVTFKKMSGGTYISDSSNYNIEEAARGGKTKGNAIISVEKEGILGMQSLEGNGNGSMLSLRNNGQINIIGKKFCFNDSRGERGPNTEACFTVDDLSYIKDNNKQRDDIPKTIPMGVAVAPSKYLRTRNYMDY